MGKAMLEQVIVDHEHLAELKREFDEFGYVLLEDVLPRSKVDALVAVIDELHSSHASHEHRNKTKGGFNMRPVIDKHPIFMDLLIWPKTFAAVAKFLDHFNIQLMQSHLFEADPENTERVTGWHNDGGEPAIEVNGIRAFGSLKVGYFLRDRMHDDMGSLMVVPGSHRIQGRPPFPPGASDPVGAIQVKAKAGDAIVFQQGLWHAAAPNRSSESRILLYYGYGYRVFRPIDYQQMPERVLENRTPIERQLLGETVTHQGYYLPTTEDTPLRPWYEENFGEPLNRGNLTLRHAKSER